MLTTPVVPLTGDAAALVAAGADVSGLLELELELELLEHAATVRLSATAVASPTGRRYRIMNLSSSSMIGITELDPRPCRGRHARQAEARSRLPRRRDNWPRAGRGAGATRFPCR